MRGRALGIAAIVAAIIASLLLECAYFGNGGAVQDSDVFGFLNGFLFESMFGALGLGIVAAVLVANRALAALAARPRTSVGVPLLAGVGAACLWFVIGGNYVIGTVNDLVYYSGGPPFDWPSLIFSVVGILAVLAAAAVFWVAAASVPIRRRRVVSLLLLASTVPGIAIIGAVGIAVATRPLSSRWAVRGDGSLAP